jgi:hypothetical protein
MHNIGVGGDFFDLKWKFLNRPISKLKQKKICLWQIIWKKVLAPNSMAMDAILA